MLLHRICIPIVEFLAATLVLILMPHLTWSTSSDTCFQRIDIAFAVDVTSSESVADFHQVTSMMKEIVSKYVIGQTKTHLALLSYAQSAQVVKNFADINSLSDFSAALDELRLVSGRASVSSALQTARSLVLNHVRKAGNNSAAVLILIRDGRSEYFGSDEAELDRVKTEAAAVKSMRVPIHAVSLGGLWNVNELRALFGSDYLLFLSWSKAMESVQSLNNRRICFECQGKFEKPGLCLAGWRELLKFDKIEAVDSVRNAVCRTEIRRQFERCNKTDTCNKFDRISGVCKSADAKTEVTSVWLHYSSRQKSCVTHQSVVDVSCDKTKCQAQPADVIILLEKSKAIRTNFNKVKQAAKALVQSFIVDKAQVRFGLITSHSRIETLCQPTDDQSEAALLTLIDAISMHWSDFGRAMTHRGLDRVKDSFERYSRPNVAKFLVLITDGNMLMPERSFQSTIWLKKLGVTIFVIGIGSVNEIDLRIMTAPESDTNMLIVTDFDQLIYSTKRFAARLCLQMEPPNPVLCEANLTLHSISSCAYKMQQMTRIDYRFDADQKCVKRMETTSSGRCKKFCTDPINGRQYFEGESWTSSCHEFLCDNNGQLQILPNSKCLSADGTCKSVNSAPFKCKDSSGSVMDSCRCALNGSQAVLIIEQIF